MLTKKMLMRKKRAMRVRRRLKQQIDKPRLIIQRSNRQIAAHIFDDEKGVTLFGGVAKKKEAALLGEMIAKKAKEKNVESVIFDRGACKYHGIVASFADAARNAGLKF